MVVGKNLTFLLVAWWLKSPPNCQKIHPSLVPCNPGVPLLGTVHLGGRTFRLKATRARETLDAEVLPASKTHFIAEELMARAKEAEPTVFFGRVGGFSITFLVEGAPSFLWEVSFWNPFF